MKKELSEMTLEELWELFPIFLVAHDDRWSDYYSEIEKALTRLLVDQPVVRISHIGSTAIQGIWAKNIVDVMVEISEKADMEKSARLRAKWFYQTIRHPSPCVNFSPSIRSNIGL